MTSSREKANPSPITRYPLPITLTPDSRTPVRKSGRTPASDWLLPTPQVGDRIRINDLHFVCAGMEFEIDGVDLDWVRTTDNSLFHRDYFDVIECSLPNSIFVRESVQAFPPLASSPEDLTSSDCATSSPTESMDISEISCCPASPTSPSSTMLGNEAIGNRGEDSCQVSSQLLPPVRHSLLKEKDWEQTTQGIAFQQSWMQSPSSNQNLPSSKTSQVCSPAQLDQGNHQVHISDTCSEPLTPSGTMRNGFVFPAPTLKRPGLAKGYCWLPRPGALSNNLSKSRPPGTSKFEGKCKQLGLLGRNQVANPEFLEAVFGLPIGWTDPSELRAATQLLGNADLHLGTASIQDWQRSHSGASSTSIASSSDSVADISDLVTDNSTLIVKRGERAVSTKPNRVREPDPEPYDESSLVKAESVQVEVLEELDEDEERDRHRLELRVERAFYEAGVALRELRDRRLYRSTHKTFEDYIRERFGYSRITAHYKIAAAAVVDNLLTNGEQILPTNERQVRDLMKYTPELQCSIWSQSVEEAGGKVPSGRIVKGIVEQLKEKPLVNAKNYCQVGDVFTLVRLEGKEKKYNGCWAIAVEPRDFTVIVDVHDTTLTVKPENLNKIDSPEAHRQLPQILQRIRKVREVPGFRDRAAYAMLEHMGKQTYLTPLEEKILQVIEREYGVVDVEREVER
jgi:hypothetical protein